MQTLYPAELRYIAEQVQAYQEFFDKVSQLSTTGVGGVEWLGELDLSIYDENGKTLGVIGWTEDGVIGFTVKDA
jgi:hypothetical protein